MHFLALFAQIKPAGSPFERPEIIWGSVALAGALLVGGLRHLLRGQVAETSGARGETKRTGTDGLSRHV